MFFLFMSQTVYADFDMQAAIDAARPGEIVHIPAGRYQGNFIVTKPITLQGEEGTELIGERDKPALRIENTAKVTVENITLSGKNKAIVASDVDGLELRKLQIKDVHTGVHIQRSKNVRIHEVNVAGSEAHYSQKGNGVAVFKSEDITIEGNTIERVQDGIYVEEVTRVVVQRNKVTSSRYGTHFMYTSDAEALFNTYLHNVTGLMIMMTTDILLENNTVANHFDFNGYGMLLYDVQQAKIKLNTIKNNRTGVALQKSSNIQIETNDFQMNQTALEGTKVNGDTTASSNNFTGNILTARSDKQGFQLVSNYYDDYSGIDLKDNGFGDIPYVAVSSFGQWMVRQPVYQYFVASPSVILLTSLDQQINKTEKNMLIDNTPRLVMKDTKEKNKVNMVQMLVGLFLTLSSLWLWKRGITE
ncbi:right-handed parallel beta-helix repeat-containing protein [Lysinibacillus agricola]|uniref:Right-handed parallel beta-helix repeat-containing protein n=1 Tax=Lysinibacillus agricola TaxID=2590012 RepID=A0ABX7B028_9BACI|nr:copper-binding protein [Lysinibacillus sp. FJAT-14222]QQP15082.1 right-handed parallel beta-helix repeat-containing protein [Lysinibacillus agricola]